MIGREQEIERVVQILNRRQKNNPCLIGEPGVGKTAIAEGLAQRISKGDVPFKLRNKEVYLLDLTALVAGTQFRGQFESRMKGLIDEVKRLGNIILMIDEVHNIVGAGDAEGSMNAANILKPALSRGEIQVIGATTFNEYRKSIEKDTALERRFQPVTVNEPSIEDSVQILQGLAPKYEQYHGVKISEGILRQAVLLSERYITDRFLPDKAIDLIDEACSDLNLKDPDISRRMEIQRELDDYEKERTMLEEQEEKAEGDYARMAELKSKELQLNTELNSLLEKGDPQLSMENLAHVIELWTKIPAAKIREQEFQRLSQLEVRLKSHIIGQDEAVSAVAAAVRRNRVGISPKHKPVSFIFVGPTGVGKTELVKQLATDLFNTPDALIRLDMSEFMEKHSVSRLVGSPPGYVGYDEAGQLTEKIRRKPYAVVLFDEIEKAHPDVLNILLQILDDGEITDAHGRKVNFENTIIVMTSNAGSATKGGHRGLRPLRERAGRRPGHEGAPAVPAAGVHQPGGRGHYLQPPQRGELPRHRTYHAERTGGFPEGERHHLHLRRRTGGAFDEEVLLPDLRRPEPAAHHPEGAGGPHGHKDHRQLRASHHPGEGHGGGRCHSAVHPVTGGRGEGGPCCFGRIWIPAVPTASGASRSTSGRWPASSGASWRWSTTAGHSNTTP